MRVAVIGVPDPDGRVDAALAKAAFQVTRVELSSGGGLDLPSASKSVSRSSPDVLVVDLSAGGPEAASIATAAEHLADKAPLPLVMVATHDTYPIVRAWGSRIQSYLQPHEIEGYLELEIRSILRIMASRRQLEELLEETAHARFAVDARGYNVETSRAELAMLGCYDPDEILGRLHTETHWLYPDERRKLICALRRNRGKVKDYHAVFKQPRSGEPFWIQGHCSIVREPESGARRIVGFYRDITEKFVHDKYQSALSRIRSTCERVDDVPRIVVEAVRGTMLARVVVFLALDRTNDVFIACHADGLSPEQQREVSGEYCPREAMVNLAEGRWEPGEEQRLAFSIRPTAESEMLMLCPVGAENNAIACIAVLGSHNPYPDSLRMRMLDDFLGEVAPSINTLVKLQINRLYEAMHRANRETAVGIHRVEQFLERLLEALHNEVPFQGASIFQISRTHYKLRLAATTGLVGAPARREVEYDIGSGLTGRVAETKEVILALEVGRDNDRYLEDVPSPPRFWVGIPLYGPNNDLVGVLRVMNRTQAGNPCSLLPFLPWDVQALEAAGTQAELMLSVLGAEEQRAEMLARVTHEIRAPANLIRANLDILRRQYPDKARFEQRCEDIQFEAEALADQVRTLDMLFGPPVLRPYNEGPTALRPLLLAMVRLLKPELREHRINLSQVEISLSSSASLRVGKTDMHQVLWNLFQNAIRYAKPNAPEQFRIQVDGMLSRRRACIVFRDWGIGILEEDRTRIFKMGVRGQNAQRASVRGYGLGLAICKKNIELYDGAIEVSNLSDPTEITITFPGDRVAP